MKKFMFVFAILTLAFVSIAYAGIGVQEEGTGEGEAGVLNFGGSMDVSVSDNVATVNVNNTIVTITASTDTPSAVTAARTGYMYVLKASAAVGGVGYTLTLPAAAEGLTYSFATGDGKTLSVKCAGSDQIYYGGAKGQGKTIRVTSPACTGSTLTLVGVSGGWYVKSMTSGATVLGSYANWTRSATT